MIIDEQWALFDRVFWSYIGEIGNLLGAARFALVRALRCHRRPVSWHRPPQHLVKRGIDADYMLLLRISWGTTTLMDAFTVANIMNRLARAEGELKGAIEGNRSMRTECEFWHEQCRKRDEEMAKLLRILADTHPEGVVLLHQGGQVTGAVQLFRHGGNDGDTI